MRFRFDENLKKKKKPVNEEVHVFVGAKLFL